MSGSGERSCVCCAALDPLCCISCLAASSKVLPPPSFSTVPTGVPVTPVGLGTSTGQAAESAAGVELERVVDLVELAVELRADNPQNVGLSLETW